MNVKGKNQYSRSKRVGLVLFVILAAIVFYFGESLLGIWEAGYMKNAVQFTRQTVSASETIEAFKGKTLRQAQDYVLEQLDDCEWAGGPMTIFDDNISGTLSSKDKASTGHLRFKQSTVQQYVKLIQGKDISAEEAYAVMINKDRSWDLARPIIFEKDGIGNWKNCANSRQLKVQVELVKSMMK